MERSYIGGAGEAVRWKLEMLETLDMLGDAITDGREIYCEPVDLDGTDAIPFDMTFHPENSEPDQSGV